MCFIELCISTPTNSPQFMLSLEILELPGALSMITLAPVGVPRCHGSMPCPSIAWSWIVHIPNIHIKYHIKYCSHPGFTSGDFPCYFLFGCKTFCSHPYKYTPSVFRARRMLPTHWLEDQSSLWQKSEPVFTTRFSTALDFLSIATSVSTSKMASSKLCLIAWCQKPSTLPMLCFSDKACYLAVLSVFSFQIDDSVGPLTIVAVGQNCWVLEVRLLGS